MRLREVGLQLGFRTDPLIIYWSINYLLTQNNRYQRAGSSMITVGLDDKQVWELSIRKKTSH